MKIINAIKSPFILNLVIILLFLVAGEAFAATYYVSTAGSDSNSGSSSAPFKTIQKAADTVDPGDTVIVKSGTYTDTNGDNYIVKMRSGGTSSNWVTFKSDKKWGAVLDGQGTTGYGWGIAAGSYIQIEDFEVKNLKNVGFHINNTSNSTNIYYYGNKVHDIARRKIACSASDITTGHTGFFNPFNSKYITYDSNIIYNVGRLPGGCDAQKDHALDHGIYAHSYNTTVVNNVFYNNTSGWAIQLDGREGTSNWKIINNTFYGKNPEKDGHIIIWGNCDNILIQNNISHSPLNYFIHAGTEQNDDTVTIKNNLVYGASVLRESGSGYIQSGNITGQDPKFVSLTNKDFHLQSGSPAINKGLPISGYDADADGNSIVGNPDIGAYEYGGTASSDSTAPSVPSGLTATAASSSQIDLSWTASTDSVGVTGYKVYRSGTLVGTVATTRYSDTGLTASTAYSYKVAAYDAAGNTSSQSASVSATTKAGTSTDTTAPSVPSGLAATAASSSQIDLSWTASTDRVGVTGYKVYRSGTLVGTVATTRYSDTGLTASTSYSYKVSAYDAAGNTSSQSASVSATTTASSTTTTNRVIVDNGDTGTSYTGSWANSSASNPYGSSSLWGSGTETYTWRANLEAGSYDVYMWWTAYSDRSTVAPVTVTHSSGSRTVRVNQQTNGGKWNLLGTFTFGSSGTVKISGTGSSSVTVCADAVKFVKKTTTTTDTTAPSVPSGLRATAASGSQIDLSWTASTDTVGVTGYKVYRNGTEVGTSATTSYSDTGLTASTSYTYAVAAYDAAGNISAKSSSVSATTQSTDVADVIIDNGSSKTSFTGTWSSSGSTGQYGTSSLWSRDGSTYTWTFTPRVTGTYKVWMWWTEWSTRSTSVPIDITYSGGTRRINVNQQINGGKWNGLYSYNFEAGKTYKVTITAQPGPSSTCADAVKFEYKPTI